MSLENALPAAPCRLIHRFGQLCLPCQSGAERHTNEDPTAVRQWLPMWRSSDLFRHESRSRRPIRGSREPCHHGDKIEEQPRLSQAMHSASPCAHVDPTDENGEHVLLPAGRGERELAAPDCRQSTEGQAAHGSTILDGPSQTLHVRLYGL